MPPNKGGRLGIRLTIYLQEAKEKFTQRPIDVDQTSPSHVDDVQKIGAKIEHQHDGIK